MIILVGGAVLFSVVGAMYWMESRRDGNSRMLRMLRAYAAVVLAFLLAQCGRLESRWFYVPAVIVAACAVIGFVRVRRDLLRRAQKGNPEG